MTNPAVEALKRIFAATEKTADPVTVMFDIRDICRHALAQAEQTPVGVSGETSDGYHTFNELYRFRKLYNAALFNEWAALGKFSVHKSRRHHDGEECFGGGWFIVVAILPGGQISNHYELSDWDLFKVTEAEKALFEFDGHTATDVADRLESLSLASPPPSGASLPGRGAGRWVNEELFDELDRTLSLFHGARKLLESLRAAPSFPKEGE